MDLDDDVIYTSYFAQLRNMPANVEPIAISNSIPDWYTGKRYKELAPAWDLVHEAKNGKTDRFESEYNEMLQSLSADTVVEDLLDMADDDKIVCLICYEKPGDFCHRKLVSKWLVENGYSSMEMTFKK